jgi:septal ring factor EnvC (AmiA/AmiB activator)
LSSSLLSQAAVHKEVADIRRVNKKLSRPLAKNRALVQELQKDLAQYKQDKILLAAVQDALSQLEDRVKNTEWETEITLQKLVALREERDELSRRLRETVYNVQQKTGFKNLLLEKKLTAMSQDLEKTVSMGVRGGKKGSVEAAGKSHARKGILLLSSCDHFPTLLGICPCRGVGFHQPSSRDYR